MVEPIWVTTEMARAIHDQQIATHGGAYGIRDEGLLSSALARPRDRWGYERADLFQVAAAYGYGIAKNHPFVDGNKRTAFQVTAVFLEMNDRPLYVPEPEVVLIMRDLAAGRVSEIEFGEWLKQGCT